MARLLFDEVLLPSGCHMTLFEMGTTIGGLPAIAPDRLSDVRFSANGIAVLTRCEDFGDVELVVWVGDPGPASAGWSVAFDGELETKSRGFDVGTATASLVHLVAPPGSYRVRVETRRDASGEVDGVRFILPDSPDVDGEKRW